MNIMETIIAMKSERCCCISMMRREALAEPSNEDVAEPDLIVSGTAGTGHENHAWRVLTTELSCAIIGELDDAFYTTTRWVSRLQRQITRLEARSLTKRSTCPTSG
jgi:hypothetical protein